MTSTAEFGGSERFRVIRRLGAGAYGVVYEAHDAERDERVALKTLRWGDPAAIYRLKKEFRALTDVVHRNLVTLYELFLDERHWFYSMELVDGVEFTEFVGKHGRASDRVRQTLRQLVEGVAAIHGAGILHRDLKPSNVLVSSDGRVVILDFGIVRELPSTYGVMETVEESVLGTAAYMAPEQAVADASEASDWYAVGTMLYESLSGTLPYTGSAFNILAAKQTQDAPTLDADALGIPRDLAALALRLLARDPAERPSRAQLFEATGVTDSAIADTLRRPHRLAGRDAQLRLLSESLAVVRSGGTAGVVVSGASGLGKTALVQRFLESISSQPDIVALTGRCFVRESVPYKGIDGIIDNLSRFLRALQPGEADTLLTDDVAPLVRLFPVLARVDAIGDRASAVREVHDPIELRRRAFAALRALLAGIGRRWKPVLWIDDFQWTDADSLALLDELLAMPGAPSLMFIATQRPEAFVDGTPTAGWIARAHKRGLRAIDLDPVSSDVANELALALLKGRVDDAAHRARRIADEAGGSPFLVEQMARFLLSSSGVPAAGGLTLGDMLNARINRLPSGARDLFEVVATAGRPIRVRTATLAAQIETDVRPLIAVLSANHLVRPTGLADHIEPFHDRLREACTSALPRERHDALHLRLALAMELQESDDFEVLYEHFAVAGRHSEASRYAERAAQRAAQGLAFERAALLYRAAIDLRKVADAETPSTALALRVGLADALANAGRGLAAAEAYLAAADLAAPSEVVDLQRRAAEELLRTGHIDQGMALLDGVIRHVGLRLAGSPRRALAGLLLRRLRLRLRGFGFNECDAADLDDETRRRLDTCWGVAIGLARVDNIRAADIQSLNLLLSLDAGEPYRIARALAAEEGFLSTSGHPAARRVAHLEQVTTDLAARIQHPHASGMAEFAAGVARFYRGEFASSLARTERAEAIFRTRCTGAAWETATVQTYSLGSLCYLGRWRELAHRVPIRLREARERGDLYATADVAAGRPNLTWLLNDDVAGARAAHGETMDRWSPRGFHFQHYVSLLTLCNIDLYAGEYQSASDRVRSTWKPLRRSMLLRIQLIRIEALHLRARCALAEGAASANPGPFLRIAERDAHRILAERCAWADGLGRLILAGCANLRGRRGMAASLAYEAAREFAANDISGYAAVARWHAGRLAAARHDSAAAQAWASDAGVMVMPSICAMLGPGFPE